MSVNILAYSPQEHEAFNNDVDFDKTVKDVAQMVMDLNEGPVNLEILVVLNEDHATNNETFTLAFSGSELSLEFSPERIEVCHFNAGDERTLAEFSRSQVKEATLWLINEL